MDSETKGTAYYPDLKHSIGLVILLFIIGAPFTFILKKLAASNLQWDLFLLTGLHSLMKYTIVILIGLWMMRKRNNDEYKLKFKRVSLPRLLILILMGVAVGIIGMVITRFIPMTPKMAVLSRFMSQPNIFHFISAVVVAPIVEEIFYRGIILEGLLKNYKPAKAIIWSAIIFGVIHLNRWQGISTTLFGLLVGWAYWKTNSLIPGLIIHCLNNLISSLGWFKYFRSSEYMMLLFFVIAIIVIASGYKLLNGKLATETKPSEA